MATHRILYLHAEMTSSAEFRAHMGSMETLLLARGLDPITVRVDGSDPANLPIRKAMFQCSRRRGLYPQLFLQPLSEPEGSPNGLVFVGGWDEIRRYNDNEDDLGSLSAKLRPALGDRDMGWEGSPAAGATAKSGSAGEGGPGEAAGEAGASPQPAQPAVMAQESSVSATGGVAVDQFEAEDDGEGGFGADYDAGAGAGAGAVWPGGEAPAADSADAWEAVLTDQGEEFYHNVVSGEVSWTKPAALGGCDWQRFLTDDGRPYFYNRVSNETVWERPEGVDV
ncbi:hypothetical protein FNF29_05936 [Cafeteria roenbergensis]|uniref:WW domain-containing protein n=1 Tax=Cafeteria roenbergensis TaxID=33653 RepID=A0A5A8CC09_CAFRO|nr:hypothetical protein FNF29_05936 [Cafeteria roenbergensis]|eukprot:KAA0149550.1 hypothetical protein FNF29_05936 [Cafeteria roenbergensis]